MRFCQIFLFLCACQSPGSTPEEIQMGVTFPPDPEDPDGVAGPAVLALPAVTGTAAEGELLTASLGNYAGAPVLTAYWQRCVADVCSDLASATEGGTYRAEFADVGATLRVRVFAVNSDGTSIVSSSHTAVVTAAGPPMNITPPSFSAAHVFQTFQIVDGVWKSARPFTVAYQWQHCRGGACTALPAMTQYVSTNSDVGVTLRVTATATSSAGSSSVTIDSGILDCAVSLQTPVTYAGMVAATGSDLAWGATGEVFAQDDVFATAGPLAPGQVTATLVARGFAFALENAVVTGIEVRIRRKASVASALRDHLVSISLGNNTLVKTPSAETWATSNEAVVYGGAGDLWGLAEITLGMLNAATFAVRLNALNTGESVTTAFIDSVEVVAHYTAYSVVGPSDPATVVNSGGQGVAWTTPQNAQSSAAGNASVDLTNVNQMSQLLMASGFSLSLPAGAALTGVLVEVARAPTGPASAAVMETALVTPPQGSKGAAAASSLLVGGYVQLGGPDDLWNAPLTAAAVAASGFTFAYGLTSLGGSLTASVGHIRMSAFYDPVAQSANRPPSSALVETASAAWSNLDKARLDDGNLASATVGFRRLSHTLQFSSFGLAVPTGAAISGITVAVNRYANARSGDTGAKDVRIALLPSSDNRATDNVWDTSSQIATYGGATDTWGRAWSNVSDFGVTLNVTQDAAPASLGAYVDAVSAVVNYCIP